MQRFTHYALLFIALAITNGSYAQSTIVIKFSHVASISSPRGMAAARFKELAELMTKGRVRVDIYANGQLYKDNEELEALQLNAVQMLVPPLSKFSALGIREFEVFDLPYLFPNYDGLHRVTQGPIGRDLLNKLDSKGMVGLGYWDGGFKNISANRPIHTPSDMRGLRIRIPPSKVLDSQMRALGATPWALTYPAVVESLRNNFIDGSENPPTNFISRPAGGSQKFLTLTNHGYLGYAVVVNKDFWDELPSDIRVQLSNAMFETTKYANNIAQQQNEQDLAVIKKSGKTVVYDLTDNEKDQWRKALIPIQQQMENRLGKELINAINRQLGNPSDFNLMVH